jgi:hypothetical protein
MRQLMAPLKEKQTKALLILFVEALLWTLVIEACSW